MTEFKINKKNCLFLLVEENTRIFQFNILIANGVQFINSYFKPF